MEGVKPMALNNKQRTFCREYIVDLNGTQAAIRAGYSEKTAKQVGSRLLTNVDVQSEVGRLIDERNKRTEVTADRVINQLAKIAFMDMKDFVDWGTEERKIFIDGEVETIPVDYVRMRERDRIDGTLIQSIKMGKHGTIVEFPDRMKALEALAKHTGVYDDRPNVNVDVNGFVEALKQTAQQVNGLWDDDEDNDPGGDLDGEG